MKKIFISGPMTGLFDFNRQAFDDAEAALRGAGYDVFNPANNGLPKENTLWETHMRRDIAALMECDAVAVLPGSEYSRGARMEVAMALELGITPVRRFEDWIGGGE